MRREYVNSEAHCYKERVSEIEREREGGRERDRERVVPSNSARRPFISVTSVALFRKQKRRKW